MKRIGIALALMALVLTGVNANEKKEEVPPAVEEQTLPAEGEVLPAEDGAAPAEDKAQ